MKNNKEWIGEWYFPVKGKEVTFYGTLKYSVENGGILKASASNLFDILTDFLPLLMNDIIDDEYEIIKGHEHRTNKPMTLYKCNIRQTSYQSGAEVTLDIGFIIDGLEYKDITSLNCSSIQFQLSGLGEWLRIKGAWLNLSNKSTFKSFSIDYHQPDNLLFAIDEYFDLEIIFSHNSGIGGGNRFEHLIAEYYFIRIISKQQSISFRFFLKLLEAYRRLMSILMDYECFPLDLKIFILSDIENGNKKIEEYQVYYKPSFQEFPIENILSIDMLFTYSDLGIDTYEKILMKWFSYIDQEDMDYVHWILSSHLTSFSEDIFLANARALEVFHRITDNYLLFTEEKKAYLISKIIETITINDIYDLPKSEISKDLTNDYEKILKKIVNSLNFINEPIFRERLKSMIKYLKARTDPKLFKKFLKDPKDLIHNTVENRNHYTHYGKVKNADINIEEMERKILKLHKITIYLNKLLLVFVLENLGIPANETIGKIVNGKYSPYYVDKKP